MARLSSGRHSADLPKEENKEELLGRWGRIVHLCTLFVPSLALVLSLMQFWSVILIFCSMQAFGRNPLEHT